jgi:N-acylneuraminate cytidylyltransferase
MSVACLAVIPARGGSKGVPRKNVMPVAGLPLVAHAIRAALAAERITRLVVSTDDLEIARVAAQHGAEVVLRPPELSGDGASSESAVLHVLTTLRERDAYVPDLTMMIQCTSPLTTAVPFTHFLWSLDDEGRAQPIQHEGKKRKRRQELAPQYLESGAAYLMRTQAFVASGERFCGRVTLYVSAAERCLEIDDPIDLAKAEAAARHLQRGEQQRRLPAHVAGLVMDFDGVLTDDRVSVDQAGVESVRCSRSDGLGLALLRDAGVRLLILSKERNPVVTARAQKLRIECLQGVDDKLSALRQWSEQQRVPPAQLVYIGNDVNDLACMGYAGCAAVPADAHPRAVRAAQIVLAQRGGRGAVRALCDLILAARGLGA